MSLEEGLAKDGRRVASPPLGRGSLQFLEDPEQEPQHGFKDEGFLDHGGHAESILVARSVLGFVSTMTCAFTPSPFRERAG